MALREATTLEKVNELIVAIKLNGLAVPDGPIDFNKQQAVSLVIENRTDDPISPVDGQIWLRTDL